ncbi:MAG: hypothetical protein RMJ97_12265 [Raineya sp.]|nr:hypothetical protein [Raineya sp.]
MANITIHVVDETGSPLVASLFDVFATTNYSFAPASSATFSLPDNEAFTLQIDAPAYRQYL